MTMMLSIVPVTYFKLPVAKLADVTGPVYTRGDISACEGAPASSWPVVRPRPTEVTAVDQDIGV